jgi:hypothetical protein
MIKFIITILGYAFMINSYAWGNTSSTDIIQTLLKEIPSITLEGEQVNSFYVKGVLLIPTDSALNFTIAGQLPHDLSMVISDQNNIPILIAKNNQVAIYEPVSGSLMTAPLLPSFQIKMEPTNPGVNQFRMGIAVTQEKKDKTENASFKKKVIAIDVPSIIKSIEGNIKFDRLDDDSYLITGKTKKQQNPVLIEMNKSGITKMKMIQHGKTRPILQLDTIILNTEIVADYFIFPRSLLDQSKLTSTEIGDLSDQNISRIISLLFIGNMALDSENPTSYESRLEKGSHSKIEFDKIKSLKKAYSQKIESIYTDKIMFSNQRVAPTVKTSGDPVNE